VEDFHEGEFFDTGQSGQIKPVVLFSVLKIISLVLDSFERNSSQSRKGNEKMEKNQVLLPGEFKDDMVSFTIETFVNIGFFSDTDFANNGSNSSSFHESLVHWLKFHPSMTLIHYIKCQIIVAQIGQLISFVYPITFRGISSMREAYISWNLC